MKHYACTGWYTCLQLQWTDQDGVSSLWLSDKVNDQELHKILKKKSWTIRVQLKLWECFQSVGRQVFGPGINLSKSVRKTWLGPERNQPLHRGLPKGVQRYSQSLQIQSRTEAFISAHERDQVGDLSRHWSINLTAVIGFDPRNDFTKNFTNSSSYYVTMCSTNPYVWNNELQLDQER